MFLHVSKWQRVPLSTNSPYWSGLFSIFFSTSPILAAIQLNIWAEISLKNESAGSHIFSVLFTLKVAQESNKNKNT